MQTALSQPSPRGSDHGCVPTVASSAGDAEKAILLYLARTSGAGPATENDQSALAEAVTEVVAFDNNRSLAAFPLRADHRYVVIEGWAYRAHTLPNGLCQITDLFLPGDCFGRIETGWHEARPVLRSCGRMKVAALRQEIVAGQDIVSLRARWGWLRDANARVLRSRLISLGRRDARERVARFMVEVQGRLNAVGLVRGGAFICPLTQEQLADIVGLTAVHINRVLKRLRDEGLLLVDRPRVLIPDTTALNAATGFPPSIARVHEEKVA